MWGYLSDYFMTKLESVVTGDVAGWVSLKMIRKSRGQCSEVVGADSGVWKIIFE